jgi:thymidine phosphorylase
VAEGIGGLVLDVKVGRGAFMKTEADARALAATLVDLAGRHAVSAEALLTRMDAPLGLAVGNSHEVIESLETLKGRGPEDLEQLSVELAARMVFLAGLANDGSEAEAAVRAALDSGQGVERFRAIIATQGGDPRVVDDYGLLPVGSLQEPVRADREGIVAGLDAERVGLAAVALGAGRDRVDADVDPGAGIEVLAPVGSAVTEGDAVLLLIANDPVRIESARAILAGAVTIGASPSALLPGVLDRITARPAS